MPDSKPPPGPEDDTARLAWLDVARAIAASSVALMHLLDETFPRWRAFDLSFFNPGVFGVILFFLVSGFVIPLSLDRRGSLATFAVLRFFRLYPLYWASLIAMVGLHAINLGSLPPEFMARFDQSLFWNVTMIQYWVDVPDAVGLYWSLAFELLFYATMAILFLLRLQRRTDWVVGAGSAYVLLRGAILPFFGFDVYFSASAFWVLTFFVGTLWYRGWIGALSPVRVKVLTAAFLGSIAAACAVTYGVMKTRMDLDIIHPRAAVSAWAAAYATFGLLLWSRAGSKSQWAQWLGRISYSLYLVHGVLIEIPLPLSKLATLGVRLAVLVPISAATFAYIERPAMRLGRRLVARPRATGDQAERAPPVKGPRTSVSAFGVWVPRITAIAIVVALVIGTVRYRRHRMVEEGRIEFDDASAWALLGGWSGPEREGPDGITFNWCAAKSCSVRLRIKRMGDHVVRIRVCPFRYPGANPQTMTLFVNGVAVGTDAVHENWNIVSFEVDAPLWHPGRNDVAFEFAYAVAPQGNVENADDTRTLAAAFDWLSFGHRR